MMGGPKEQHLLLTKRKTWVHDAHPPPASFVAVAKTGSDTIDTHIRRPAVVAAVAVVVAAEAAVVVAAAVKRRVVRLPSSSSCPGQSH